MRNKEVLKEAFKNILLNDGSIKVGDATLCYVSRGLIKKKEYQVFSKTVKEMFDNIDLAIDCFYKVVYE